MARALGEGAVGKLVPKLLENKTLAYVDEQGNDVAIPTGGGVADVTTLTENTLFVSAANGDDATGEKGTLNAYETIGAAVADAVAGDIIKVASGNYIETNLYKNGVTFNFEKGAVVTANPSAGLTTGLFESGASSSGQICIITGQGTFKNDRLAGGGNSRDVFECNGGATIKVDAFEILSSSGRALASNLGHIIANADRILGNDAVADSAGEGGDITVTARLLQTTDDAHGLECDGGTIIARANKLSATNTTGTPIIEALDGNIIATIDEIEYDGGINDDMIIALSGNITLNGSILNAPNVRNHAVVSTGTINLNGVTTTPGTTLRTDIIAGGKINKYALDSVEINGQPLSAGSITLFDQIDNTADEDKPVSTAQQTALNQKANDDEVVKSINNLQPDASGNVTIAVSSDESLVNSRGDASFARPDVEIAYFNAHVVPNTAEVVDRIYPTPADPPTLAGTNENNLTITVGTDKTTKGLDYVEVEIWKTGEAADVTQYSPTNDQVEQTFNIAETQFPEEAVDVEWNIRARSVPAALLDGASNPIPGATVSDLRSVWTDTITFTRSGSGIDLTTNLVEWYDFDVANGNTGPFVGGNGSGINLTRLNNTEVSTTGPIAGTGSLVNNTDDLVGAETAVLSPTYNVLHVRQVFKIAQEGFASAERSLIEIYQDSNINPGTPTLLFRARGRFTVAGDNTTFEVTSEHFRKNEGGTASLNVLDVPYDITNKNMVLNMVLDVTNEGAQTFAIYLDAPGETRLTATSTRTGTGSNASNPANKIGFRGYGRVDGNSDFKIDGCAFWDSIPTTAQLNALADPSLTFADL